MNKQILPNKSFVLSFNVETTIENLKSIKSILDSIQCTFYPGFGTFLGMYRDKAIIPWDHDSDLIVFGEIQYKKILTNFQKFDNAGFAILRNDSGSIISFGKNKNYTDIYPFYLVNNVWQNGGYHIHPKQIEDAVYLNIFDRDWLVFKYPEEYLLNCYGKTWKEPIKGRCAQG